MAAKNPPRIWVPRRLWVSPDGELRSGPCAGILVEGLRSSVAGGATPLMDLRHTVWLVERAALDDALIDEQAIVLPERLIDKERQPHAHAWLASLPLVCISGLKWARLVAGERLRLYRVAVDDRGGKLALEVEAAGTKAPPWSFRAFFAAIERAAAADHARAHPPPSLADRLLGQLSNGALCEEAVVAAWQAAQLCEPGYGYRGATDGEARGLSEIAREASALDEVFAQIDARAEDQRDAAAAIAQALARADSDAAQVPLPLYDHAERSVEPALAIELDAAALSHRLGGQEQPALSLPAQSRWFVAAVEPWEPAAPREVGHRRHGSMPPPARLAVAVAMLLLAAIAAVALALRAGMLAR